MTARGPRWRCTWVWVPARIAPGPRKPATADYATEAEAQDKAAALREMAADMGATVAVSVKQEGTA